MNLAISILRAMLMNCGAKVEFIWWLWNETVNILTDKKPVLIKHKKKVFYSGVQKSNSVLTQSDSQVSIQKDSLFRNNSVPEMHLHKIPVYAKIGLDRGIISNMLVEPNSTFINPAFEDERSKLNKFIAKTFREKILKENTSNDGPLKSYDIAAAGVTGLNKLFGWEMTLDKNNDENGELRSIYFSSKILKFNAPVNKAESMP